MVERDAPPRTETGRRVATGGMGTNDFTYTVFEAPSTSGRPAERRGEVRTQSRFREGFVGERRGKRLADCRIRDLSKRGARLQLDKDRPLPKAFVLTEAGTHTTFLATLAWQVGRDAGVRLTPIP